MTEGTLTVDQASLPSPGELPPGETVREVHKTTCCVVGGGPAGIMLGLLLARRGVQVTVLEAHRDFDRDFRGDTIHPSTLELIDQLGLSERLHALPHAKIRSLEIVTPTGSHPIARFERLGSPHPYIMMLPQARFLEFLAAEAAKLPCFKLVMGANVQRLIERDDRVRGVYYRLSDGAWCKVDADLTVAADGRFSKLRRLAGMEPEATAPPMDVVWFRLPRHETDPIEQGQFYVGNGHMVVLLDRQDQWQVGYVIAKGAYQQLRTEGIELLRKHLLELLPWLGDRVESLTGWQQVSVLSVESNCLRKWYRPGLLLIGDAAHVMSPVGGVGINYAIQDAIEAANLLAEPLRQHLLETEDLARVQFRREMPVRMVQRLQGIIQRQIVAPALKEGPVKLPLLLRLLPRVPLLRNVPAQMIAYGIHRSRLHEPKGSLRT